MTMLQPDSDHWYYSDALENDELIAVRHHIIAGLSRVNALCQVYPEYQEKMNDPDRNLYLTRKLKAKASEFFRRPKIRKCIANCREEIAKDAGIDKAEWVLRVLDDAETAREDNQHMAVAKNMELVGKGLGFMENTVTVKHQHVTQGQVEAGIAEELKVLKDTQPEKYKEMLATFAGDENKVKVIESNSYKTEPINVSSTVVSPLDS